MKANFSFLTQIQKNTEVLDTIEDCSKVTLGPTGKNGMVSNLDKPLQFLTNGSMLLKSLEFPNPEDNLILKLIEQASTKTSLIAGDGSTLTSLFLCQLLKISFPFLAAGYNNLFLSTGLKKLACFFNEKIMEFSVPISTPNQLIGVLKTSLGKKVKRDLIAVLEKAITEVSRDGLILVEENIIQENELEIVQGIELDKGFASSYFVNDLNSFEVVYENPFVLITTNPINNLNQLENIITHIQTTNKPLVLVVEEIQKDVLSTLILNNIKKKLKIVVIKYTSIKFIKSGILEDLALLTHANYSEKFGGFEKTNLKKDINAFFQVEDLGKVQKVIITKSKSTFLVSKFSKVLINRRINELNRELLLSESEYEKTIFKTRIARLSGNILKVKLANSTQYEMDEIRQKVDKVMLTIKSSLEEGVLPGGCCFSTSMIEEVLTWGSLNLIGEEIFAAQIVAQSLLKLQQELLTDLSGKNYSKIFLELQCLGYPYSYNLLEQQIVNTLETNLLDSSKAIRGSFWNSLTMVSSILTSE